MVNDYAIDVDPEGETQWVITPEFLATEQSGLVDPGLVLETSTYQSDGLRYDPAAPQWVQQWQGPFYISTEEDPDPKAEVPSEGSTLG